MAISNNEDVGSEHARGVPRPRVKAMLLTAGLVVASVSLVATPTTAEAHAPTVVSLTFDDGTRSHYDALRPVLRDRDMNGTFYINSARVGTTGYMTRTQIETLAADGNEIGGHTIDHADLVTLSQDDQRRQVCDDRVALLNMGLTVKNFAYPYGSTNNAAQAVADECGYNSARVVGGTSCEGCDPAESIPPANKYKIRTPASVKRDTSLATLQEYVTRAESGGGWVVLVFHHVCADCADTYSVDPAMLGDFLDWLKLRSDAGTQVKTVDEVIGGSMQPGVPIERPTKGNLLLNPSLESAAILNRPDCFQQGGFGNNSFTFTRTEDAHSGDYAERVKIFEYSSGDRKLVTKQDSGVCAPIGVPGHTYKVSAWYKGLWTPDVQVKPTLYYRNAAGSWVYWTSAPKLSVSATWVKTPVFVSPPLPSGATHVSYGISLPGLGTITTDDYDVTDTAHP